MRAGCAVLLALLGLTAGSPLRADITAARRLIVQCAQMAEPGARGFDALQRACPGIAEALDGLGIEPLLPSDWRRDLSPRALADFVGLEVRYADPVISESVRPDVSRLRSIALSLKAPPPSSTAASWWERFSTWLRRRLERSGGEQPSWLRFLPHLEIGPRVLQIVFVALALLVVAGAAALVLIEIRAAGGGAGRGARRSVPRPSAGADSSQGVTDLSTLESAPLRDRPVLLLRALVQALTRAHRLHRDRELTCRELVVQARFDTARQREEFEEVALLAERALYGGGEAPPPVIPRELLQSAQALHDQLAAAPAAAPEAG